MVAKPWDVHTGVFARLEYRHAFLYVHFSAVDEHWDEILIHGRSLLVENDDLFVSEDVVCAEEALPNATLFRRKLISSEDRFVVREINAQNLRMMMMMM